MPSFVEEPLVELEGPAPITVSDWTACLVGQFEATWGLTPEEHYYCFSIIEDLLRNLNIPDRSTPKIIPLALYQELAGGFWTRILRSSDESGFAIVGAFRPKVHRLQDHIPVETWCEFFVSQLALAYPDLRAEESLVLKKVMFDVLAALRVHERRTQMVTDQLASVHRLLNA